MGRLTVTEARLAFTARPVTPPDVDAVGPTVVPKRAVAGIVLRVARWSESGPLRSSRRQLHVPGGLSSGFGRVASHAGWLTTSLVVPAGSGPLTVSAFCQARDWNQDDISSFPYREETIPVA